MAKSNPLSQPRQTMSGERARRLHHGKADQRICVPRKIEYILTGKKKASKKRLALEMALRIKSAHGRVGGARRGQYHHGKIRVGAGGHSETAWLDAV